MAGMIVPNPDPSAWRGETGEWELSVIPSHLVSPKSTWATCDHALEKEIGSNHEN